LLILFHQLIHKPVLDRTPSMTETLISTLILLQAGVTNPLEYPLCVDNICGRTFALRIKWQPTWGTCSVQSLKEDEAIIKRVKDLFPKDEVFHHCIFQHPSSSVQCVCPNRPLFCRQLPTC
jgi:hypothetical protein